MTDNDIIEALEHCFTNEDCSLCPLFSKCPTSFQLEQYALDLINRQKAEIERLTKRTEEHPFKCKVGNNSEIHSKSMQDYDNLIADISAEAVKECLDKVKGQICCIPQHHFTLLEVYEVIRKTEKEKAGEG